MQDRGLDQHVAVDVGHRAEAQCLPRHRLNVLPPVGQVLGEHLFGERPGVGERGAEALSHEGGSRGPALA